MVEMMLWRGAIAAQLCPVPLCGISFSDWLRLLSANDFAIDAPYWIRAGIVSCCAVHNSLFRVLEQQLYGGAIREVVPLPPLFVLGVWRSGTTHLHNLLARDVRFAYPNLYDVLFPHTFLTTEWINAFLLSWLLPRRRPQDNVAVGIGEPQEDDVALTCLTQQTRTLSGSFPRRSGHYDRFLTFRNCNESEIARFRHALHWFVQKLTYKYRRPLVLKSPAHTGRIRLLLDIFPDARFVFIHRNPYEVFMSELHSTQKVMPWRTMQLANVGNVEERILRQFEELFDAYFCDRRLIPSRRLHEMSFESLCSNPIGELEALYDALRLEDFRDTEADVRRYLVSIGHYRKNALPAIAPSWKDEVARRLRRCFDEWQYVI